MGRLSLEKVSAGWATLDLVSLSLSRLYSINHIYVVDTPRMLIRMFYYSKSVKAILDAWPGKQTFGIYRFMPLFFLLGATLEFSMINWHVGEVNFYKVYKKRKITEALQEENLVTSTNKS